MALNGATAIWSGYNHQGRAGLFVALREINKLTADKKELEGWKLVFELGEDFQIVYQSENQPQEIISRHQVKAYSSVAPSRYENVFTRHQKLNSKGEPKLEDGKPVMVDGFNIEGVPIEGRFIHVIKSLDISSWKNDFSIQLYEYPAIGDTNSPKQYCDFSKATNEEDELMSFALAEIELATEKDSSEARLIWKELQHNLQAKISVAHRDKTFAEFTFLELKNTIATTESIVAYDADKRRRSILEYGDDFIGQKEDIPTFTDEHKSRVVGYIQDLTSLDNDIILQSLRYLHISDTKLLDVNSNGMKEVVYNTLSQIVSHNYESNCIQFEKNGSSYILTVITEMGQGEGDEQQGTNKYLAGKIAESLVKEDVALIFRKAKIVNKSLDADFSDVLGEERSTAYIAERIVFNITDPAPLEFVSVDRAVAELNGEDV